METKLLDLCGQHGIEVKSISHRIRFKDCPFCGNEKWKVWLYTNKDGSIAGSCFKCGQKFSLYRLLCQYGLSSNELRELFRYKAPESYFLDKLELLSEQTQKAFISDSISIQLPSWRYWGIDEIPMHPASIYARSRGIPESLYPEIKIDTEANAVVFLVKDEQGNLIGYQSRYTDPKTENKTYTAYGFKTANSLLRYYNSGDLFVCEGPFNAISAYNWGHTGLCTFGSKISDWQLKEIRNIAKKLNKQICCAFDMDEPGFKAYLQVKDVCEGYGIDVLRVKPEYGNDLNDSWKKGMKYEVVKDDLTFFHYLPELK